MEHLPKRKFNTVMQLTDIKFPSSMLKLSFAKQLILNLTGQQELQNHNSDLYMVWQHYFFFWRFCFEAGCHSTILNAILTNLILNFVSFFIQNVKILSTDWPVYFWNYNFKITCKIFFIHHSKMKSSHLFFLIIFFFIITLCVQSKRREK